MQVEKSFVLTKLKERVQAMLATEARAARKLGLTPNMISVIGIGFALLSAVAYNGWRIHTSYLLVATFLLLLSGFCDALDGVLARLCDETTAFGGFFDSLLDRYADAFVYVGIIVADLCNILSGLAALIGSLLVSYCRARAEAAGIKMESVGFAERAERIIMLAVAGIAAMFWEPQTIMNIGVILLATLSNLTVLQRSLYVHNRLKKGKRWKD